MGRSTRHPTRVLKGHLARDSRPSKSTPDGARFSLFAARRCGGQTTTLVVFIALSSCGGGRSAFAPAPTPATVTVSFEYRASTATNPAIAAAAPSCVAGVGQTHIHPSWRSFERVNLTAVGSELWTGSFNDVAPGRHSIRISDPNACAANPTGAVTTPNVFANGTLLTQIVDTPGSGIEPGFAFTVDASARVTP